jgi:hypothetical protein
VPLCPFKHVAIHSWVFTLLQGVTGAHLSTASVRVTALSVTVLSLSWAFSPFSDRQLKGSSARGPIPQHVASSEFQPLLTPCSPSSLPTISGRVALGIHPSGPFSSQESTDLSDPPSLLGITHPSDRTLAMSGRWTQASSRVMTPRECKGRPPSRPCSS